MLNFQYRIVAHIRSLVGRLAIQNRSFEAGGLDAIASGIDQARSQGDEASSDCSRRSRRRDRARALRQRSHRCNDRLRSAGGPGCRRALAASAETFAAVIGPEGMAGATFAADWQGRLDAGFRSDEIELARDLAEQRRHGSTDPVPGAT